MDLNLEIRCFGGESDRTWCDTKGEKVLWCRTGSKFTFGNVKMEALFSIEMFVYKYEENLYRFGA